MSKVKYLGAEFSNPVGVSQESRHWSSRGKRINFFEQGCAQTLTGVESKGETLEPS